jgi:drug/metabolite transporter (DMT)-like permease
MPTYLIGVLAAFVEPAAHGWANVLDQYFSGSVFTRLTPFIFWSVPFSLAAIPVVWFLDPPGSVSGFFMLLIVLVVVAEIAYQYPYFWALQELDTSVVASLFSLGKVFLPFFAFWFLGESLAPAQYSGFFLIIGASVFLATDLRALRINRGFFFMLAASLMLVGQTLLMKYLFDNGVGWGTLIIWMSVLEAVMLTALVLLPKNRASLIESTKNLKGKWWLFLQLNAVSWLGNTVSPFALSLIPVTVARAVDGTQPMFALSYALLLSKKRPELFREYVGRDNVMKKVLLFVCMIVGATLAVAG